MNTGLNTYRNIGAHGGVAAATPHGLIVMLLDGALAQISTAKGHMARHEIGSRGECISRAIAIIDNLRASLDFEVGGEIAANLEALYDYMNRRLLAANVEERPELLDEVAGLLGEIKLAWDAIPADSRQSSARYGT
jgi:flagellar protein FliS